MKLHLTLPSVKIVLFFFAIEQNETKDRLVHKANYTSSLSTRLETSEPAANVRSTSRGKAVPVGVDERWVPRERLDVTTPKTSDAFFK